MTREEIKELLPIMQAFAEGKPIQDKIEGVTDWVDTDEINLKFEGQKILHRIKPQPKYRLFKSQEECWNEMLKHQPLGWLRSKRVKDICQLITIKDGEIRIFADLPLYFSRAYREYEFLDGTPFGIKEG